MRAVLAFVLVVPVALSASRFSGVFPYSHHRPFLSGGVVGGFYSVRIATFSVAACEGPIRASGSKVIQRPCGARLQKLHGLVHSPLSPNPSPPPPGGSGELNNPMWSTRCAGWRSRADANIQTRREPRELGTRLTLSVFTLKVGGSR